MNLSRTKTLFLSSKEIKIEFGYVLANFDGILHIAGLSSAAFGEIVKVRNIKNLYLDFLIINFSPTHADLSQRLSFTREFTEEEICNCFSTNIERSSYMEYFEKLLLQSKFGGLNIRPFTLDNNGGIIMNLLHDKIIAPVFGKSNQIKVGDVCFNQKELPFVKASYKILGKIVNAFGQIVFSTSLKLTADHNFYKKMQIDTKGPSIIERFKVNENLLTGIKIIDSLIPIGRGQRELIIGDRQTGKTSIILDTILNQKYEMLLSGRPVFCIYVNIGQRTSHVSRFFSILEKFKALATTLIVSASAADSVVEQYLAPFSATAFGEFFMYEGHDVLIAYDDLSKHAVAYRQLSLLLRRAPGREAYPGDVFYLHARLLERSANLLRYGSITSLPVIETLSGDVSAYIPTNVISITDGQIFLDTNLFYQGILPAINIGLSVSRVGAAAQFSLLKKVAGSLKLDLALFREIEGFASFSANLDEETTLMLKKGQILLESLKQDKFECISLQDQIITIFVVVKNLLIDLDVYETRDFIKTLFNVLNIFFTSKESTTFWEVPSMFTLLFFMAKKIKFLEGYGILCCLFLNEINEMEIESVDYIPDLFSHYKLGYAITFWGKKKKIVKKNNIFNRKKGKLCFGVLDTFYK